MAYTRPLDDIRVGGEIDAMCTKCKIPTNHRIVAMVDGIVRRVICLTCDSQHNFKKVGNDKKTGKTVTKRVTKDKKMVTTAGGKKTFELWLEKKNNLKTEVLPYSFKVLYEDEQAIQHSKFGLGFIQKVILPNKIEIMFEDEVKILAMNMK